MDTPAFREFLKALLAEGALAALVIYAICVRQRLQARMWPLFIALVLIGAGAVASYYEFGWVRYGRFMNPHDFYHYYTGTKYAPELGYHNQYAASQFRQSPLVPTAPVYPVANDPHPTGE